MTVQTRNNFVNGAWIPGATGETYVQHNPANLEEVTGYYQKSTVEDTQAAIAAAQAAYPAWKATPPIERAAILRRAHAAMVARKEELAAILTRENGKTLAESMGEVQAAIHEMDFQIGEGLRIYGETVPSQMEGVFAYSTREPLGVVGVICPWNFPFNVPGRKCTPALMAGNTCVVKPSILTPHVGIAFTELFDNIGLPPGVLNCVTGGGGQVGETLVNDPRVRAITFTGSTDVGMGIARKAAANLTRTQLEMGGKNPTVVLEDADLDVAAAATVKAAYACAGQWCTSTSRAVVVEEVAEEFIRRVVEGARALRVGPGDAPDTDMGPVCGTAQLEGILGYIEAGKKEGATLLLGGGRLTGEGYDAGCFIAPTIFGDVNMDMTIAKEEIFGPVLCIIRVKDFEEAVEVANAVPFGLSSSIFTRDFDRALQFVERSEVGLTHVNMPSAHKEPQLPFGGIKESGFGLPEAGKSGIEFFTEHKVAYVKYR